VVTWSLLIGLAGKQMEFVSCGFAVGDGVFFFAYEYGPLVTFDVPHLLGYVWDMYICMQVTPCIHGVWLCMSHFR
jgi:hypothetical protein